MPKSNRSEKRAAKRARQLMNENIHMDHISDVKDAFSAYPTKGKVEPKTKNQELYIQSILANTLTIGTGAAGTGKTFLAVNCACDMLENKEIDKIIITRPAIESGKSLGALPGELDEKMQPYIEPVIDILNERLGKSKTEWLFKNKKIVCEPVNFLRGKSFDRVCLILDESQNTTPGEMLTILTRIGLHSKIIVNGDEKQQDTRGVSGLTDAINRLRGMDSSDVVYFTIDDIVRSGFVRDVLIRYQ